LHQWYWSYEYSDYETESGDPIEFDSYMIPDSDLEIGQSRLLEVDNPIILPSNTHVRFIVTSTDVLHDFAIPSAGIKIDATPGRLNQSSFFSEREGELFGQCSELCGTYHGFMPIQVEVGSVEDYLSWISSLGLLPLLNSKNRIKLNSKKYVLNPFLRLSYIPNMVISSALHSIWYLYTKVQEMMEKALVFTIGCVHGLSKFLSTIRKKIDFFVLLILPRFAQILSYPCGFISKNIYLTISILFSVVVAYLVRLSGLENIVNLFSNSSAFVYSFWTSIVFFLLIFNSIYLKFIIFTKFYFLVKYAKSNVFSNYSSKIAYLFVNCIFLLLISFIIYRNEEVLLYTDPNCYAHLFFCASIPCCASASIPMGEGEDIFIIPKVLILYGYICAITFASVWIEWHHQSDTEDLKPLPLSRYNIIYLIYNSFILCLFLLPFTWYFLFIFTSGDSIFKLVYCSSESNNLEEDIKLSDEETKLSDEEVLNTKKDLIKFKEEIKKIREEEVYQEVENVNDFLSKNNNNYSSFEEAFPNYLTKTGLIKEVVDENIKEDSVTILLKELDMILQKCKEAGIEKKCLEKIQISDITKKVLSNSNNTEDIKGKVESLFYEQLNKIGDMTLKELYEKTLIFKDKFEYNVKINVNYLEVGSYLVGYSLLLRSFNKFIYNQPISPIHSAEEIRTIRLTRSVGRVFFASVVAPLMLFSFNHLRKQSSFLDIKVNINNKENSTMFLIFLKNFLSRASRWVKMSIFLLLFAIFLIWYLSAFGEVNWILNFNLNASIIDPYLKILLIISIMIPIILNAIVLLLFVLIERKGTVSSYVLPLFEKNKYSKKFIGYLIHICSKKELLSYYRGRNTAEIKFYLVLLLFVLIFY
jgi:hypothetical protein